LLPFGVLVAVGVLLTLPAPSHAAADSWTANLATGTNADGRLEVFMVDANGTLRHRWQRESLHDWSTWSTLGSPFSPGIAVVNDSTGRLGVFAVDQLTRSVKCNFQKTPNSPAWSNWVSLPAQEVRGPLGAIQDTDGRLEVFAVSAQDDSVRHIWQDDSFQDWSAWTNMGGSFEPGVVVVGNKTGQLELYGIDHHTQQLMHCWQTSPDVPNEWSGWSGLNQRILPGFAVEQNMDGRLEIAGVNAGDGLVVHAFQLSATPASNWSPWYSLGAKMKPVIALGRNRDGRIEIFTVNPANSIIYHAFQAKAGATTNWIQWTDMSLVGGLKIQQGTGGKTNGPRWADVGGSTRSYPVIGKGTEGDMEIFAFDERLDDVLNYRRQISGNLSWSDWRSLDHATFQYLSRVWRMDDGLPDDRIQAITQTPDGYIWVGTHNGLTRFDGARFVSCDVKNLLGLTNPCITSLCVDQNGILWIGSGMEGLTGIGRGRVDHFTSSNGLAGDCVTSIHEAGDRSLWIGTTTGLSHYQAGKFANYTTKNRLVSNHIRSVLEDSEGLVWITTDQGLNRMDGKSITTYTRNNGLPDNSPTGIWQDVPGRLWIGSDHGLVFYRSQRFYAYDRRYGLSDRLTSAIRSDSQGNLWVGNNSGLSQFKDGRFIEVFDGQGNSFGRINTLFEDREGNLWAGSQDGLFQLTPKRLLVYDKQQLTHNNVTAVLEDYAGTLWAGTWGGGLDQLKNETVTAYGPETGFRFDLITSLCTGRDNSVWVSGSYGDGLVQLQHGGVVYRTAMGQLTNATIKVMHEDRSGNLWIGHSKGLACLANGKFLTNRATGQMIGNEVRAICEGRDGELWFGTQNGLNRWRDGQFTRFSSKNGLSDDSVTALYQDEKKVLWIGTENKGLNRFGAEHFSQYTAQDGLFSNEILEIIEDDSGWLWITCPKGVFRVLKKELDDFDHKRVPAITSIAYGHDDGMGSVLCGRGKPGAWKTRDGELWFPTDQGLVAIDPRILKINRTPPPVYIEDLIADMRSLPNGNALNKSGILSAQASSPTAIQVPPGRGNLEFQYTALSFQRPERIRFKYKLDGMDSEWIQAGTRRVAYYNNLSPGRYTFHVAACNSDGVWNDVGASMSLILLPHFWQGWWFRGLAISAVFATVIGTVRKVTKKRMQRKLERIEQRHAVEKERLRIAQDIHDDLGGSLTQIALLGELAMGSMASNPPQAAWHLAKITNAARLNVRALDEIVWAVHPGNDTLDNLILYLWQFAEEFFRATATRCRVEAPENIPPHPLSSDLRHGIFLAVKEAFNNAIKHARATEVHLRFNVTRSDFSIAIEDNGHGFHIDAVNKSSRHGLANMRRRIEKMGGKIMFSSTPGHGTRIEFVLPLKNYHDAN
jgi:ligand-binding sensor domain-containing protein/signal transduction histidine kinase